MNSLTSKTTFSISGIIILLAAVFSSAQDTARPQITPSGIHIGERLSYSISFERYQNVGFAETYAVSRGKLGDSDAVELRMKFKTTGLLSAAFILIDESRTTFVSPDTGNPVFIRKQNNSGVAVHETTSNYMTAPASGLDLLSLIYHARQSAGAGSFVLLEGEKNYGVTFQPQGGDHIKTDAGDFDVTTSNVQSDYFLENGIQSVHVSFSNDDAHIPVMAKLKTAKGEIRIVLSSTQIVEPEVDPSPTPTPGQTPRTVMTPRPVVTPTPFIENQPLLPELGFPLGESLTYRVTNGSRPIGEITLQAKERRLINREDSLLLAATVTSATQGNGVLAAGDSIVAQVNPDTLAPFEIGLRLSGPLSKLNQTARFDQKAGMIVTSTGRIDAPIGTHCILSLIYAIRSFNLSPSKDLSNPVNDTRVAVYWEGRTYIFTLRPSEPEPITVNGQKIVGQRVTVNTGVPQLDSLGLKFWLSLDPSRVPLRIALGPYQADLIAQSRTASK